MYLTARLLNINTHLTSFDASMKALVYPIRHTYTLFYILIQLVGVADLPVAGELLVDFILKFIH